MEAGKNVDNSMQCAFENVQGLGGQLLPTATASREYQNQRSAEGGSAIDARSSEVG